MKQTLNATYPTVSHGKGIWLYDTTGKAYIDGSGGAMTASIGHAVPEIAAAVARQMDSVSFSYRTQFTNAPAEALADRLAALAPGDLNYVFFVNSGSEAAEHSIRVALHVWRERGQPQKTRILARNRSYHGMTMGALSMSGHDVRRKDYGPLLHTFPAVPPAYCFRCPWGKNRATCDLDCAEAWEQAILAEGPENVAAVIAEPVVGAAGGVLMPKEGYFRRLREICDKYDVLLILDEVITGMGRTGDWFASHWNDVVPDILMIGKGLSAGYTPMAAVLLREPLVASMRAGTGTAPFGHTFSGNPLSAATCLAVLDYMQDHDVIANARARGEQLGNGLRALAQRFGFMADVRGRGMLWGFEFVTGADRYDPPAPSKALASKFGDLCFAEGLIVYPSGVAPLNNAVLLSPPLTITADEVTELLARLERGLEQIAPQFEAAA
jgi:adenosylmethionine-8-amino-7-oxononanoate aminotransferase